MGCPTSRVSMLNADTDKTPYDSGTFASVGMMVPTKAVENAAVALREKILELRQPDQRREARAIAASTTIASSAAAARYR